MMRGLVFDIETEASPQLQTLLGTTEKIEQLEEIAFSADNGKEEADTVAMVRRFADSNGINIPANWKKPEPMFRKCRDHFDNLIDKAATKQWGCQIRSIACKDVAGVTGDLAWIRENKGALPKKPGYTPPMVWTCDENHDEREVISAFWEHIVSCYQENVTFIGFNIRGRGGWKKGFDIPILRVRHAMLGIPWPGWMPDTCLHDLRYSIHLWDICDVLQEGTCDQWLAMAGLPQKSASGADVANMTPKEVAIYNADDVEKERLLAGIVMQTQPPDIQDLLYADE